MPKKIFTYIFVIREPRSTTYQKFLHSDRVELSRVQHWVKFGCDTKGDLTPPHSDRVNYQFQCIFILVS